MLNINDAFYKFKTRLELNEKERDNAIQRHTEVRTLLHSKFDMDTSFLTGSYARYTKTKPLKDIDIFFILNESEKIYLGQSPNIIIDKFYAVLVEKFGKDAVRKQSRSVNVDFGVVADIEDDTDYRIVSIDAVPAFKEGECYKIPDVEQNSWIKTNPTIHAEKAVEAHKAYSNEWKGLVRMIKYWNNNKKHGEKPIKPSFLIEVMALECLYGGWGGRFDYEIQALFSTLATRIFEVWPDPAGYGPPISNDMNKEKKQRAHELLLQASQQATLAINHVRQGRNGDALKLWRELFGPKFPLS